MRAGRHLRFFESLFCRRIAWLYFMILSYSFKYHGIHQLGQATLLQVELYSKT
jgi:hypothetical protein